MPTIKKIKAHFDKLDRYFSSPGGDHYFIEGTGPYEYLLGALSGCFTYTLYDECEGKVCFDSVDISIVGTKRDESPTVLVDTQMSLVVKGCSDQELFLECLEQTKAHCSIFNTISKVSRMGVSVEFS